MSYSGSPVAFSTGKHNSGIRGTTNPIWDFKMSGGM